MTKEEALNSILRTYDAFYIENKYDRGKTHKEEFEILEKTFEGDNYMLKVLNDIKHGYDCYYEEEMRKDTRIRWLIDEVNK